jgi:hypothetical protein
MTTKPQSVVPFRASGVPASANPWLSVLLAVGAGLLAAFQVGKCTTRCP